MSFTYIKVTHCDDYDQANGTTLAGGDVYSYVSPLVVRLQFEKMNSMMCVYTFEDYWIKETRFTNFPLSDLRNFFLQKNESNSLSSSYFLLL